MMMLKPAAAIFFLALALPVAAEDQASTCDELAASPLDGSRAADVPGVAFGQIDIGAAETACRAEWEAGREPRHAYQLGRTLMQAERLDKAAGAFRAAAELGHVEAKTGLAQALMAIARAESAALMEAAAEAGSQNAFYNLGVAAMDEGDGARALEYFEKAAAMGDADAAYNIGVIYDEGELVLRDVAQARAAYETAVAGGFGWAKINLAYLLLEGTPDAADRERAVALFRAAAEDDGDTNAGLQLALLLQDGTEAEQDESAALVLAALRARDFELARVLQDGGKGVSTRNLAVALEELAAEDLAAAVAKLPAYYAQ
jgi:TPR repeat protein